YEGHVNKLHGRTGALYEGRFKSSLVETSRYFLACMRYIEMNPVRAGIVRHPGAYSWSSYGQNITGDPSGLVTPHSEYLLLGRDASRRATAYARLFEDPIDQSEISLIRRAAQQGKALGSEPYCAGLEKLLGRSVRVVPQ